MKDARALVSASGVVISRWAILLLAVISCFTHAALAKVAGTVKSINQNSIVLATDDGADGTVTLSQSTGVLRLTPGQTDLKGATPIPASEIAVGDRVLALGARGEGNSTLASIIIVMKQSDIADKRQQEREAWRRGVGGIVKSTDARSGTITIANSLVASGKPIVLHVTSQTSIRRYAADSIKFEDARPGTLNQITPGDQLCALGTKNAAGGEFDAQAIVSGTFRYIDATVISIDPAGNSITLTDLAKKKPMVIRISKDSELRRLPPVMAARMAVRLKSGTPEGVSAGARGAGQGANAGFGPGAGNRGVWQGRSAESGSWQGARGGTGQGGGEADSGSGGNRGGPDLQQLISGAPVFSISELKKGDALLLVATEGTPASEPTAITLLAGVEPILSAAPTGAAAATVLLPWNLGASSTGDTAAQ